MGDNVFSVENIPDAEVDGQVGGTEVESLVEANIQGMIRRQTVTVDSCLVEYSTVDGLGSLDIKGCIRSTPCVIPFYAEFQGVGRLVTALYGKDVSVIVHSVSPYPLKISVAGAEIGGADDSVNLIG